MYFKVVMELWGEIFHKMCDSCFCTYEQQICESYVIITSSLRKNNDSRRHDDVISLHSR